MSQGWQGYGRDAVRNCTFHPEVKFEASYLVIGIIWEGGDAEIVVDRLAISPYSAESHKDTSVVGTACLRACPTVLSSRFVAIRCSVVTLSKAILADIYAVLCREDDAGE